MTVSALFAAVIAVCSILSVPMPSGVPITLQTFAVALCGFSLPRKNSLAAIVVYLLLGTVGIPVFSGLRGGIGVLFGATGGFLFGFVLMTFLCSLSAKGGLRLLWGIFGLLACHTTGVLWYTVVAKTPFFSAALAVSLPYLPKDIVFVLIACLLSQKLRKLFFDFS